jgi:hypothetical protein
MGDEGTGDEVYIVGDIHGDLTSLNRELWARGLLRSGNWRKGCHLICVGDYTDRNRGGVAVLRILRTLEEEGHATCLLGNHDVVMIGAALIVRRRGGLPPAFTAETDVSEGPLDEEGILARLFRSCGAFPQEALSIAADEGLLAWLRRRPLMSRAADLLIVHADNAHPLEWGATLCEVNTLGRQVTEGDNLTHLLALFSGLTDRYAFVREDEDDLVLPGDDRAAAARAAAPALLDEMLGRFGGSTLVHGHSVFSTGDAAPLVYSAGRAVNVDRGAGYPQRRGKLCVISVAELTEQLRQHRAARA